MSECNCHKDWELPCPVHSVTETDAKMCSLHAGDHSEGCIHCTLELMQNEIDTLQKDNETLADQSHDLRQQAIKALERLIDCQEDNSDLKADLTEAEGAVADLMKLNDTLTADEDLSLNTIVKLKAEVERLKIQGNQLELLSSKKSQSCGDLVHRAEKAEAEVENYKRVIKSALIDEDCGAPSIGFRKLAKLLDESNLNHKEE